MTEKDEDVAPSTTTDIVRSDRKLAISLVRGDDIKRWELGYIHIGM